MRAAAWLALLAGSAAAADEAALLGFTAEGSRAPAGDGGAVPVPPRGPSAARPTTAS